MVKSTPRKTTKKTSKSSKKTGLRSTLKFLPSGKNRWVIVLSVLIVAVGGGAIFLKLSGASSALSEGTGGCYYNFYEARTNFSRAYYSRRTLTPYGSLELHACDLAGRMAARGALFHDISWRNPPNAVGQIVGRGTKGYGASLWVSFMNSPEHRPIILNPNYRNMGCAYKYSGTKIWAVCNYQYFQ